MADFPPFAFTTQESWYGELSFKAAEDGSALPLTGRQFEMHITPATSGSQLVPPVLILTTEEGRGLTLKQGDPGTLVFRVPKTTANDFPRGEFTADVLEVVGGERYLFMPVRITYAEPSGLRAFLTRFLGVSVSFAARQQPIYTPLAVPGREGRPGATILRGTVPPVPADGKDGDFYIEDRTASGQGRRMWGPKAGGAWPGTPWNIQVAAISDVPGLPKAIEDSAQRAANLNDLFDKAEARQNLGVTSLLADKRDKTDGAFTGTVTAPFVLATGRGLKLSEFTNKSSESSDLTVEAQTGLSALLSGGKYTHLDLEGRRVRLSAPLTFGTATQTAWPRSITNGSISVVVGTFPEDAFMFDFSGCPNLYNFAMYGVNMLGGNVANLIKMPPQYFGFSIYGGQFSNPKTICIDDMTASGGDSHELLLDGARFDSSQYWSNAPKTKTMLISNNADITMKGVIGAHFKVGCDLYASAHLISDTHIWDEGSGDGKGSPAFIFRKTGYGSSHLTNIYLDNTYIVLSNEVDPTKPIGEITIDGIRMLGTQHTTDANFGFIRFEPRAANCGVENLVIDRANLIQLGAPLVRQIVYDTTYGTIDSTKIKGLEVRGPHVDNNRRRRYTTDGLFNIRFNTQSVVTVDTTLMIPPFCRIVGAQVSSPMLFEGDASPVSVVRVNRIGTKSLRIELSRAATCTVAVRLDVNAPDTLALT